MNNSNLDPTPAIQIDGLTKTYDNFTAVNDLTLHVKQGEIFGFLGLNGAGKSTTIKMMLSLLKPTSGNIHIHGEKISPGNTRIWNEVGYLEDATYYPELTVIENLEITRRMQLINDRKAVSQIITKLGLEPHKNKKAKHLSLGNKQRLALAKAMIHQPKVLLLDEPINGLDPAGVVDIRQMLIQLSRQDGVTVFVSSHQLEELSKLVDRIGIIHQGRLLQTIDMGELQDALYRYLIINGHDKKAMKHILSKSGYTYECHRDGRILLYDEIATSSPDRIAQLLVNGGQPPTQLHILTEDLESYFLRMIQTKGGR